MSTIQNSSTVSRPVGASQSAEVTETPKSVGSEKAESSQAPVAQSAEEKKAAQGVANQNKSTQEMQASMKQHDLQSQFGGQPGKSGAAKKAKGEEIYKENGITISKDKNGHHTVEGAGKKHLPGKANDGVNGVVVKGNDGKSHVFVFDKNDKNGQIQEFTSKHYTPKQIERMWEQERAKNPKATNDEIREAVVKRKNAEVAQAAEAAKAKASAGSDVLMDENGITILKNKKSGLHKVLGENKDRIEGKPNDGVNAVYVEGKDGKPLVVVLDKNDKKGLPHRFEPKHFTPQQIERMWEEERAKNPKATNNEIADAVKQKRNEAYEKAGIKRSSAE